MTDEAQLSDAAATVSIRDMDGAVMNRLRERASQNGRTIEAEALAILVEAIGTPPASSEPDLYDAIRARFEPLGGVDLEIPPRGPVREPPRFE